MWHQIKLHLTHTFCRIVLPLLVGIREDKAVEQASEAEVIADMYLSQRRRKGGINAPA
jgi:hypothetical protein